MKKELLLFMLVLALASCIKEVRMSKLNKQQLLKPGEWYDVNDSLSGVSVREDKIAFFKNNAFTGHDICQYSIIDSVLERGDREVKFGEYLLAKGYIDTIQYQIIDRNDSLLSLSKNGQIRKFVWKKYIVFQ